jgi:hypothetical protein
MASLQHTTLLETDLIDITMFLHEDGSTAITVVNKKTGYYKRISNRKAIELLEFNDLPSFEV